MDILNQFIKYIKLDDEKRILVSLQDVLTPHLEDKNTRSMLKGMLKDILKDDFSQLEIGKNICRVTVKEGTEEKNIELIKTELVKNLEMAMQFLSQMQGDK